MFTSETPVSSPVSGADRPRERRQAVRVSPLFDPVYLATSIWASRGLILFVMLLGLAASVAVAMTTPKRYTATTQILVDPRDIKVVANEVTPNGLPSEATLALIESQTAVILSNNVLSRVVAKTDLENDPEFNGKLKSGLSTLLPAAFTSVLSRPDDELRERELRVLERLRHALTVERETKSFVINLSVASMDPRKAAELANVIAEVFIAEQGRVQSDTARRATDSLSARLSELRRSVVEAEGHVEDYKSQNALIGVGGRLVDDDYIVRINDQLAKARGDITGLRVRADSMRQASVEDVVRGTLPEELSSAALVRLRQSYSDLAQQAAIIATKLGPRHPQRIASEGALGAARQAIAGELGRIVAAAQTELARATQTERNLSAQIEELKAKQVETSGSFVKLRELEREVDASRAVYEAFLLRARETSEQESLNTANIRVISDASVPLDPTGMSRKIIVIAGLLVGLALGIGLAGLLAVLRVLRGTPPKVERRSAPAQVESQGLAEPQGGTESNLGPVRVIYHPTEAAFGDSPVTGDSTVTSGAIPEAVDAAASARRREPGIASSDPAFAPAPLRASAESEGVLLRRRLPDLFESRIEADETSGTQAQDATAEGVEATKAADEADRIAAGMAPAEPGIAEAPSHASMESEGVLLRRTSTDVFEERIDRGQAEGAEAPAALAPTAADTREADERSRLRERLRGLSQGASGAAPAGATRPGMSELAHDIASIRATIADIRRRKATRV